MLAPPSTAPPVDAIPVLDDHREWLAFSRPVAGQADCWESNFVISGMHCAACSVTVEDAVRALAGVVTATVSYASGRASVRWLQSLTAPTDLLRAVQLSGYEAVPANDTFLRETRLQQSRKALWRWLVAGFCMMQVMMYAYPAYVAAPGDLTPEMEQLLRWASWVLTLPVVVFSCGPFFEAALRDVAHHRVGMDLPVALGMAITFAVSTAGTFDPQGSFGREVYFDSLTMFVFFLLCGRWLEQGLRDRTAGALEALMNRMPATVERRVTLPAPGTQGEAFERIAVHRLQAGDVIRVLPGEVFPADGTIAQGSTWADEALLTGESKPVQRGVACAVVAGSYNLSGAVIVQVERVGDETRYAQIVTLMEQAATSKPKLARLADRIAKPFLVTVLLAAVAACAFWWPQDPARAIMVAVAVLIVTCPCALSLATPTAMLASAAALARRGVMVRRLDALEALAGVDTVVFDKTGTLTGRTMMLQAIHTRQGVAADQALAMAASLARQSLHPLSRAIAEADDRTKRPAVWRALEAVEVPGQGLTGSVSPFEGPGHEGAAFQVRLGSASFCAMQDAGGDSPRVHLSDAAGWLATFDIDEQVRLDAKATVGRLQAAGIEVCLMSGDACQAARAVAARLGITNVHGGCTPDDKLARLRSMQQQGHRVAVVGDGLNDGPVQAGADASFAFGQAVPITQARADFVVLGETLMPVADSVLQARKTLVVVRQNLAWALLYNAACIPLAVLGLLPAWLAGLGMAASSVVVVANALRLNRQAARGEPVRDSRVFSNSGAC